MKKKRTIANLESVGRIRGYFGVDYLGRLVRKDDEYAAIGLQLSEGSVIKKLKRSFGMRRKRECIRIFFGCVAGCLARMAAGIQVFVVTNSVFLVRELNLQRTAEPKLRVQEKWDDIKRYSSGTWTGG